MIEILMAVGFLASVGLVVVANRLLAAGFRKEIEAVSQSSNLDWPAFTRAEDVAGYVNNFYRVHTVREINRKMTEFAQKMSTQKIDFGANAPKEAA